MNEVLCRKQTLVDSIAVSIFVDVLVGLTNTLYVFDPQFVKIFAVQESRAGGLRKEGFWGSSGTSLGAMGVFEKSVKGGGRGGSCLEAGMPSVLRHWPLC